MRLTTVVVAAVALVAAGSGCHARTDPDPVRGKTTGATGELVIPASGDVRLGTPRPARGVLTVVTGGVCVKGGTVTLLGATPVRAEGGIEVTDAVVVPTTGVLTGVYPRALADTPYRDGSREVTTGCRDEPFPTLVLEVTVAGGRTGRASAEGFEVRYGSATDPHQVSLPFGLELCPARCR